MKPTAAAAVCALALAGCGIYTFSGSTIPGHLKTIDIPLFANRSLQPEIAETITEELTRRIVSENILNNVARGGDATIRGTVLSYANHPHTYGSEGYRNVNVSEYIVTMSVEVSFMDNKKNKPLFEGVVSAEAIYDYQNESEEAGRQRAVKDIVEQIMQKSIQSW